MRRIETPQAIQQVFYLPDGRTLVVFGKEGTADSVRGWDVTTGEPNLVLLHRQAVRETEHAFLSPRGTFLVLEHREHQGSVLDQPLPGGLLLWRIPFNPSSEMDLRAVGCFFVSANWKQQPQHLNVRFPVALSADEQLVAYNSPWHPGRQLEVRRRSDNWLLGRIDFSQEVCDLSFSLDGRELFLAGHWPERATEVEFWDIASLQLVRRVGLPSSAPPLALLVADENTLILHSETGIYLLNRKTGTLRNWLEVEAGERLGDLARSPDGNRLAVCSGRSVHLLDAHSLQSREAFDWDLPSLRAVAFSPDGMTMAAGGGHRVVVWDC